MNHRLSAIALAVGIAAGAATPAQANPANDRVRLLYVFTPAAKTTIGSSSDIRAWINARTATATQTSVTFNGGQTQYQVSVNGSGVIQFNDTQPCCGAGSQNGNAVGSAAKDIGIAELRDKWDADVVVVVTASASDSDLSSLMDCSKTGAAAAKYAFVGVSIHGGATGSTVDDRISAALGKVQCAGEDDAYAFMEGFNANNCTLYRTLLSQAPSVTKDIWVVANTGLSITPGYSETGQDHANTRMVMNCPMGTMGVFSFTCVAYGTCTTSGSLTCTHTQTQTDSRGLPTCTPGSSDAGASPPGCIVTTNQQSTWSKNNFTCTGGGTNSVSVNLGLMSNPAKSYRGMAMGSSTKNAVGKMDARFGEAKLYYQTKIAPALKAAITASQEEPKK